jgi:3',5'-cyclic AMP phosphodiesterase CpdA
MTDSMIIAQISDTHIALDVPDADRRSRDFEATIADINALDPAPDAIVHTGDIVHNGRPDEYARALSILAAARVPVYVLAGNKDSRESLRAAFSSSGYIGSNTEFIDYAIEDYPVRLIAVDTLHAQSNKGDFCSERAERLIEMIDAETTKPIAVFAHHPPFEVLVGPDRLHFETEEAMRRLRQTLQHSQRIAAVFSGHVHRAAEGRVGGMPAIVMPCIATPLRRGEYPAHIKTSPVYYLHRFDPLCGFVTAARIAGFLPSRQVPDAAVTC